MINKVILVGNVGQDPETQILPSGSAVCKLSVATPEKWTKDGKAEEKTEWHRVKMFGKLAEIAQKFLSKGSKVYIEGKIQTSSWDKDDGSKAYMTEIIAREMKFLSSKGENTSSPQARATDLKNDDDVPF